MKNQLEELRRQHATVRRIWRRRLAYRGRRSSRWKRESTTLLWRWPSSSARYFNLSIEDIFDDSDDCPDAASPR